MEAQEEAVLQDVLLAAEVVQQSHRPLQVELDVVAAGQQGRGGLDEALRKLRGDAPDD